MGNFPFLKFPTITLHGRNVTIVCEFDDTQDLSCVLVGREYGNKTLLLVENIINTIDIPIDKNGTYTFSIFVMDGKHIISEEPVVTERIEIPTSDSGTATTTVLLVLRCYVHSFR